MMARFTEAEIIVVGLIGERGREVKEFIDEILGEEGSERSVVVAAPADDAPLMRLRARHLRHPHRRILPRQGQERAAADGFADPLRPWPSARSPWPSVSRRPPRAIRRSVFAKLPRLVERAGNAAAGGGSITAFYTVLSEGDDQQDPIADAARAILDGHFVLSRRPGRGRALPGHRHRGVDQPGHAARWSAPSTSSRRSASRSCGRATSRVRDLISVGAYQPGGYLLLDMAVSSSYPRLEAFLQQGISEHETYDGALQKLAQVFS